MSASPSKEVAVRITGTSASIENAAQRSQAALGRIGASADNVTRKAGGTAVQFSRLNEPLRTLAAQATGTNAAFLQLSAVVGSFALSAGTMTAVLLGLAALAKAWELITQNARDAKQAQEEATARLETLREKHFLGPTGELERDVANKRVERDRIQRELFELRDQIRDIGTRATADRGNLGEQAAKLQAEYDLAAEQVRSGEAELARIRTEAAEKEAREAEERARKAKTAREAELKREKELWERIDAAVELDDRDAGRRVRFAGAVARAASGRADPRFVNARFQDIRFEGLGDLAKRAASGRKRFGWGEDIPETLESVNRSVAPAADVVVGSFERMAQAAISGSGQMEGVVIDAFQNILGSIKTKGGGLFGASLPGMLVGAGLGIVGALFNRRSRSDPLPVRVQEVAPQAAKDFATGPSTVVVHVDGGSGRVVKRTEYELRRRESRDAVQRSPVPLWDSDE